MENIHKINQNIYITNDEEIKEGDWVIAIEGIWKNTVTKITGEPITDVWKKIILTTDQDLIKDGVQAIDDDFLEWFVQNPSCEEFTYEEYMSGKYLIPQEEPKQETLEEAAEKFAEKVFNERPNLDIDSKIWLVGGSTEGFINGAKWQQEQIGNSEFLQKLRATKSDAEARRLIKTI